MGLPHPLSRKRVWPPEPKGGGGAHSPAGKRVGESQYRRLEEKLSTLPTLWSRETVVLCSFCFPTSLGDNHVVFFSLSFYSYSSFLRHQFTHIYCTVLSLLESSSSFIEPPATGHHQWSGAKRFSKIIFFLQYFLQYTRYGERHFR